MQRGEPVFVLDRRVSSVLQEHVNNLDHIFLDGLMQGSISSDLLVLLEVHICLEVQQGLYHCYILGLHGEMQGRLPIDVPGVRICLLILQHRDCVMDIVMRNAVKKYVTSYLFYFSNHFK